MKKDKIKLLNVEFDNLTMDELIESIDEGVLVTPNVDIMVKLQNDAELYKAVKKSKWVVCDSRVICFLSRFSKHHFKEAIPGSSFFTRYYLFHKDNPACRIFLLGGLDNVAQRAKEKINGAVGREMIVGAYSPSYGFEKNKEENELICQMIEDSGANVVCVGVGCPKQEKWIYTFKDRLPGVKLWMALGATIDFEAGKIKRAPLMVQRLCQEWFYRFLKEPRRLFKRYFIDDMKFFRYLYLQYLGKYKDPFETL